MIRSMTGYGHATAETDGLKAAVSVRSVNHRYLDVSVHASRRLQALEVDLKRVVGERVRRGRVDVTVQATLEDGAEEVLVAPRPMIAGLVRALREIKTEHGLAGEVAVGDVARFPGALEVLEGAGDVDEARRRDLLAVVSRALDGLDAMRRTEGGHLRDDLEAGLREIETAAARIGGLSDEGKAARRDALAERIRAACQESGLDEGRLYQEVVRLVERSDVTEELQRLRSHVAQAREALAAEGGDGAGKRLDFLAQEMAREANTIGSKAASAGVVQEVVALKSAIERAREQVQNVE